MKHKSGRRLLSFLLTLAMVVGMMPGMSLTAYAASIYAMDGKSVTISSDQTCTSFYVFDGSTLTVNQGVTLTLNMNDGQDFNLFDNSNLELHGTLAGSVGSGATWMDNTYINVYLSDGAKYTVTGLSCMDGDNYLRYYGYDAATDGNGTVSVMNGTTDVTASSIGYKTTTYTFTATPSSGYRFVSWTKGASGEVLGTDASINVTCEQNGQYQVYANFEADAPAHDHNFTYSADGATITAACTTGCDITEGLTMTISAPTALTYDGTAKEASLSTGYNTTAFPGTYTIEYYNGTTKLDSAPVNAGTYTAKVTAGTGDVAATASVDFTITPKTVDTPTITLSPESFTYDGSAKQPTVTVKDGTTTIPASEYSIDYSNNTNAGTATVTITDKTGGNYTVSGTKTFTIERGSQSAPVVSSTNETIEGKADGTITGVTGAMEYKSAAANAYTSVSGTTIANLPAGSYNVRYKETHNYNASPAADVVINTGSKITVQFDADGGTPEPDSQQYSYSQTVSAPAADPEKTGYTFKFWSADGEAEYDFSAPLTANITLKAVYQANSYTITFDTDGGSEVAAITQDYGTAVTAPADPTKTGYTFAGWDKEIPATMPAENMTIKAKWTINQYTMTFDDNGSHSDYVLDYGENLTDYIPDIQWEGHTFMGWNPEVPETVPAEDMTFTAVWDTNTYTITFDSNGGSYVAPIVQDFGTKVIAPMNPIREGYAFIGWDKEIPAEMPAYDMTVRAQWVKAAGTGAARVSSGTARVPSGTAQPEVTASSTDEITPKMWAVLNDDNSVTVSWEKIKNADSYILYVEKNGKTVKLTETKGREVTLKKAKNGATYKFSLKYTRNGSTYSAPKGYKANLRVYYKPAVTATVTKDGKILLKWNKVANADKYVIYRVNASGKLVKAGTTTKTAAKITAKSSDTGYVVRASVNGKLTKVTKSDIATAE